VREQTSLVLDNKGKSEYTGDGKDKEITSKAPIVKFGGKECIWLNKEECENGKDKTMKLWTLELIDKAVPFDREGNHNDWGKAIELQEQCERELVNGCTKEELDMLVTVKMSSVDGYEKVEPILDNKAELSLEEKLKVLSEENQKLKAELDKKNKLIEKVCKSLGYTEMPKTEKEKAD